MSNKDNFNFIRKLFKEFRLDNDGYEDELDNVDFDNSCFHRQQQEIAYKNGWISREKLLESAERYGKSPYGEHLKKVADGKILY